jgi:hypothetical protein
MYLSTSVGTMRFSIQSRISACLKVNADRFIALEKCDFRFDVDEVSAGRFGKVHLHAASIWEMATPRSRRAAMQASRCGPNSLRLNFNNRSDQLLASGGSETTMPGKGLVSTAKRMGIGLLLGFRNVIAKLSMRKPRRLSRL